MKTAAVHSQDRNHSVRILLSLALATGILLTQNYPGYAQAPAGSRQRNPGVIPPTTQGQATSQVPQAQPTPQLPQGQGAPPAAQGQGASSAPPAGIPEDVQRQLAGANTVGAQVALPEAPPSSFEGVTGSNYIYDTLRVVTKMHPAAVVPVTGIVCRIFANRILANLLGVDGLDAMHMTMITSAILNVAL